MIKKIVIISIAIFAIFALFGCGHEEHDYDYDQGIIDNSSEEQIEAVLEEIGGGTPTPTPEIETEDNVYTAEDIEVEKSSESFSEEKGTSVVRTNRLAAGGAHVLFVAEDNSLWTWGFNGQGQVGNGTYENQFSPVKIMDDVAFVAAHWGASMAIQSDGTLWAWGDNSRGLKSNGACFLHARHDIL